MISVESNPGQGSVFTLRLPVVPRRLSPGKGTGVVK
jgi:signal transduction histidine kinase